MLSLRMTIVVACLIAVLGCISRQAENGRLYGLRQPLKPAAQSAAPPQSGSATDWERMKHIRPRGYVCHRMNSPLSIDGKLDEPAWQAVPWSELFVDIEGDAKPRPQYRTRAKMLWDEQYFYIGADLEEPHVWATLTQHDSVIFRDNDFEVFIDPDGDNHEYYEFEINAYGTGWDLFLDRPYKDGGRAQNSWEIPGLKTAVHIDGTLNDATDSDRGWSVELAFPWKALEKHAHRPVPPRDGDHWRVNFSRVEWQTDIVEGRYRKVAGRREDNWVWSPQGIINMHRPERWGYVQFSTAKPGAAAENRGQEDVGVAGDQRAAAFARLQSHGGSLSRLRLGS